MCQYESSNRLNSNVQSLSLDDIKKFIDEVAFFHPNISFVGGGEPLTHNEIADIIAYIHKKGLFVGITTNGILLEKKADELVSAGIDYVTVSIDGLPDIHNEIRNTSNAFEKAVAGIKKIKRHKGVIVQTSTTVFDSNYDHISDLFEYLSTLPIDVRFGALMMNFISENQASLHNKHFGHLFHASPVNYNELFPDNIHIETFLEIMEMVRKKYRVIWMYQPKTNGELYDYFRKPDSFLNKEKIRCPWLYSTITNTGNVVYCIDVVPHDGMVLGNIKEQSFKEIWLGEKTEQFRKVLDQHKCLPVCSRCCAHINPWNGL